MKTFKWSETKATIVDDIFSWAVLETSKWDVLVTSYEK